jgi:DNA-binding NtrC family response regulator
VDVRVLSATNRDIEQAIAQGRFREDLFYRIETVALSTPPLRERLDDIPALVRHFVKAQARRNGWRARSFSTSAHGALAQHSWKGNVRELRNVVERILILSDVDPVGAEDVRAALPAARPSASSQVPTEGPLGAIVEAFERAVVRERLRQFGGHMANTARSLGLERSHLYKKCRQLGLEAGESD